MDLCVGMLEGDVAERVGPGELAGTLDRRFRDVDPERTPRLGRPRGLPGRLPSPAADVEGVVVELDANGPAQYLVVSPQFGVVAPGAGHMFACGVSHRCPFTMAGVARAAGGHRASPCPAAYASRRSASSCGQLSAGVCPPSSVVFPGRSRATRRLSLCEDHERDQDEQFHRDPVADEWGGEAAERLRDDKM